MIIATTFHPFDRRKVFYDTATWEVLFEKAVKDDPNTANSLARLLYEIARILGHGKRGREEAVNTLKLGIEWLYPYTDAHKLSFEAFLYDLEGLMVGTDFPEELMRGAIARAVEAARCVPDLRKKKR